MKTFKELLMGIDDFENSVGYDERLEWVAVRTNYVQITSKDLEGSNFSYIDFVDKARELWEEETWGL